MATPIVPPRPSRTNGTSAAATTETIPQVPARPARKFDPSPSRSPLNELPNPAGSVRKITSRGNLSVADVPPRPPSVSSFPSVGQEGFEYASYDQLPPQAKTSAAELGAPEQTRNVAEDMPLHAPKASLAGSTAKSRIGTVTGTDSTQAAAAGIGMAKPDDDVHKTPADSPALAPVKDDDLKRSTSIEPRARPSSGAAHYSRPPSVYGDDYEHGIPHIGASVPLLKNAGDVQAPSPGPALSQHTPGVGFFNDGSQRAHQRRRSGKNEYGPPGSYGLHSHGYDHHDQFERDWYAKHPDRALAEGYNAYGQSRPETALTSAQLNRMVTQSEDAEAGGAPASTPGEEVGYSASDAYASRHSPRPALGRGRRRLSSSGSQPAVESPLRRTSFPFHGNDQHALDDDVVHVDEADYRSGGYANSVGDQGREATNTAAEGGWGMDRGPGTPALASDEVLKRRESATMHAAVNPEYHYDEYDDEHVYDSRRSSVRVPSRPSSRPGSRAGEYSGGNLHRFISHEEGHHGSGNHTPLEEIEEYEPLIPEGEDTSPRPKARASPKKRPGLEHHHFPSQDIWEDTPSSLQFSTTVQTPEEAAAGEAAKSSAYFAGSDSDQLRRVHTADETASDAKAPQHKLHYSMRGLERPGAQRFPSKDIWEDTPSSLQFQTTVGTPQMDETKNLPDDRPTTYAMYGSNDDSEARSTTGYTQHPKPAVPTRPKHRSKLTEEVLPSEVAEPTSESREISSDQPSSPEKTKAPPIPDRPKPSVPARPTRAAKADQSDGSNDLTKSISPEGQADAAPIPAIKVKPAVPARPGGEKIAALKSGFMNDLNNRLKIGPQAPPSKSRDLEPEAAEEVEKAPLADARKSRAKGPARRKPPSASAPAPASHAFSFSTTFTMWAIDESEELQVPPSSAGRSSEAPALEKTLATNIAVNTEEPTLAEPSSPEKPQSPTETIEMLKHTSPEDQRSMAAKLEADLANVGAAPASLANDESAKGVEKVDEVEKTSADLAVQEESSTVGEISATTSNTVEESGGTTTDAVEESSSTS